MTRALIRHIVKGTVLAVAAFAAVSEPWKLLAQAPEPAKGVKYAQISPTDMKEWLGYLASDLGHFDATSCRGANTARDRYGREAC